MKQKLYAAYGSNLHIAEMKQRCPQAVRVGHALLTGYALHYRGRPGDAMLTIEAQAGGVVPLGIWAVSTADEQALDVYEAFPDLYGKVTMPVMLQNASGGESPAEVFLYVMVGGMPHGQPAAHYVEICETGYRDFGFDVNILRSAVRS
ncbi:gamma-glutamylcyclotransferase family protein [uncultured Cardiobacterium sp.]|uniref:gamma-glutamylcyclotransferase family protein n=1 Tax=uncultured Cardiobacterium sp. TaxID=417619 RepID=UPI0026101DD9|nr:gamma-glutamylcyclotransferase family protein [uncultured Cardiobacterium sp.]